MFRPNHVLVRLGGMTDVPLVTKMFVGDCLLDTNNYWVH